ncbi:MAG: AraC family transcriptional regulator [Tidjanibacter sp.]|nr:AraC family transcriptional regulator [Tidjanibacter sp.]MBR6813726.1 AraC family transcriptional regulator [Tidjanibacter sp.]
MRKILRITNPNDYADYVNSPALHPLVCALHYEELGLFRRSLNRYSVYGLFIQHQFPKNIAYGMKEYETHGPSIIAVAPGQIGGVEDNGELISRRGWVVLWSPELFGGTTVESTMEEYPFFSYFYNDSLEMTPEEWERISLLISQMRSEMQHSEDGPALRGVLQGYIRLILEYCNRIYLRQRLLGDKNSSDMLKRFHQLLLEYYTANRQLSLGVPTVQYCARELAYSSRYLGDMVHRATGDTAIGYIHSFVVEKGKNLLMQGHNVGETAHLLGFEYTHHFNRIFKKITGFTPSEFLAK